MTFAEKATEYFTNLKPRTRLPRGIAIMNPYESKKTRAAVEKFYDMFYSDSNKRTYMLGINPGRFGGGLTGIAFTDPVALREYCGIENALGNKKELSSNFIYQMIMAFGGVNLFFGKVFMSALFPLALIKKGKNYNYYDDKDLFRIIKQEIAESVSSQIQFGADREKVIILGKKNAAFFAPINQEMKLFRRIIVLDHPRYIMQYRSKLIGDYIDEYIEAIRK